MARGQLRRNVGSNYPMCGLGADVCSSATPEANYRRKSRKGVSQMRKHCAVALQAKNISSNSVEACDLEFGRAPAHALLRDVAPPSPTPYPMSQSAPYSFSRKSPAISPRIAIGIEISDFLRCDIAETFLRSPIRPILAPVISLGPRAPETPPPSQLGAQSCLLAWLAPFGFHVSPVQLPRGIY